MTAWHERHIELRPNAMYFRQPRATPTEKSFIQRLVKRGYPVKHIAALTGFSADTIYGWIRRHRWR